MRRRRPGGVPALLVVLAVVAAAVASLVVRTAISGDPPDQVTRALPKLTADVLQLRSDEVGRQVQVSVTNARAEPIRVQSLALTVPGFVGGAAVPKDSPIAAGRTVNLPTPYGEPRCSGDATPSAGHPEVRLRVSTGGGPAVEVVLTPGDPDGVLDRILARECLAQRLASAIRLRFGPDWRRVGPAGDVRLHGTLEVRLLDVTTPRELTQVAGTVIYELTPDGPPATPLARVDAGRPAASVPVVVSLSRCDGHARGETKKPYEFHAWVAEPGGPEQPVTIPVTAADRTAFRAVCPL